MPTPPRPANPLDIPALRDRMSVILGRPVTADDEVGPTVHDVIDRLLTELVAPGELESLADWHETKAEKARRFPGPLERNEDVMRGKAEVHDDAARRLRALAARGVHEDAPEHDPASDNYGFTPQTPTDDWKGGRP